MEGEGFNRLITCREGRINNSVHRVGRSGIGGGGKAASLLQHSNHLVWAPTCKRNFFASHKNNKPALIYLNIIFLIKRMKNKYHSIKLAIFGS